MRALRVCVINVARPKGVTHAGTRLNHAAKPATYCHLFGGFVRHSHPYPARECPAAPEVSEANIAITKFDDV